MKVLIGIPTFQRPALLEKLLVSLSCQGGVEKHDIDVFVADNDAGARGGLAVVAKRKPSYPHSLTGEAVPQPGISAVRNAILDHARAGGHDFVAMIDDDEWAEPQWLRNLLLTAQMTAADVVGGPVVYRFAEVPPRSVLQSGAFPNKTLRCSGLVNMIDATGNVLFRCAALARIGWPRFDQEFGRTGGEDKDYFTRLSAMQLCFAWSAGAVANEHVPTERTSTRAILRRAYRIGNADMRLLRKYAGIRAQSRSLIQAAGWFAMAIPAAPLCAVTLRRLWLGRRLARAAGKVSALLNHRPMDYGVPDGGPFPSADARG